MTTLSPQPTVNKIEGVPQAERKLVNNLRQILDQNKYVITQVFKLSNGATASLSWLEGK